MDRKEALLKLQTLPCIGPFSPALIMIRGVGDPDNFPLTEKKLHKAMTKAYNLCDSPAIDTLKNIAEQWRPYRSWAGLLLRNA